MTRRSWPARLVGGKGVRLRWMGPHRTGISFHGAEADFAHPWQVSYAPGSATFHPALPFVTNVISLPSVAVTGSVSMTRVTLLVAKYS